MTLRAISVPVVAVAALSACGGKAPENNTVALVNVATSQEAAMPACTPGIAKLPVTGLCETQAAALMFVMPGKEPTPPDDCSWVLAEAKTSDGALLYRTAKCPTGTAKLEFVPGSPMASFDLVASPYPGDIDKFKMIHLLEAPDGKASVLAVARREVDDKAEAARCQIRPVTEDGRPADAFIVDEVPISTDDELRSACGTFGYDNSTQEYWRLSQGRAWFFHFGQETPLVIPETVTLVKRDAGGKWVRS